MKILVVDNGTAYIRSLLNLLAEHEVRVVPWNQFSENQPTSVETIILSGGHSLSVVGHDKEYKSELRIIREAAHPIIGICLGYELIAHAYGAPLSRLEEKEKGFVRLNVVQPHPVLLGVSEANVFESHRWVVGSVPKPLIGLAVSKDGYEIIAHETKPIFGFQFHPEMFQETTVGDEIMKNCLAFIEETLDKQPRSKQV